MKALVASDNALAQAVRFLATTGLSASITMGLPIVLHELLAVRPSIAVAIALATAFVINFMTVRSLVFRTQGSIGSQAIRFGTMAVVFRGCEYLSFLFLFDAMQLNYVLSLGAVLSISTVLKFVACRQWVFTS